MSAEKSTLHCWADYEETVLGERYFSDAWIKEYERMLEIYPNRCYSDNPPPECDKSCVAAIDAMSKTCLLEKGHDGPHEWTPDNEIIITFGEAEPIQ